MRLQTIFYLLADPHPKSNFSKKLQKVNNQNAVAGNVRKYIAWEEIYQVVLIKGPEALRNTDLWTRKISITLTLKKIYSQYDAWNGASDSCQKDIACLQRLWSVHEQEFAWCNFLLPIP